MADGKKTQIWLSLLAILWPIARSFALSRGVPLPDIGGLGDLLGYGSQVVGTTVLAKSNPV